MMLLRWCGSRLDSGLLQACVAAPHQRLCAILVVVALVVALACFAQERVLAARVARRSQRLAGLPLDNALVRATRAIIDPAQILACMYLCEILLLEKCGRILFDLEKYAELPRALYQPGTPVRRWLKELDIQLDPGSKNFVHMKVYNAAVVARLSRLLFLTKSEIASQRAGRRAGHF